MVANSNLGKAQLLDANGLVIQAVESTQVAGGLKLTLPENAMYIVLE